MFPIQTSNKIRNHSEIFTKEQNCRVKYQHFFDYLVTAQFFFCGRVFEQVQLTEELCSENSAPTSGINSSEMQITWRTQEIRHVVTRGAHLINLICMTVRNTAL